jgi:sporadic carbohydrate cluster protein (TIGR04323 family)
MIRDLGSYQGIVACSIHMMPQTAERRRVIFDTILSQWSAIHFCIEDIVVSDDPGVAKLEGIFSLLDCVRPVPDQLLLDQ